MALAAVEGEKVEVKFLGLFFCDISSKLILIFYRTEVLPLFWDCVHADATEHLSSDAAKVPPKVHPPDMRNSWIR